MIPLSLGDSPGLSFSQHYSHRMCKILSLSCSFIFLCSLSLRMASIEVLDSSSSSDSKSALYPEHVEMHNVSTTEDGSSSDLQMDGLSQSLPKKPKKKRCRYGYSSAKGNPFNNLDVNRRITKPHATGKENQLITPTTRKRRVVGSSSCFGDPRTKIWRGFMYKPRSEVEGGSTEERKKEKMQFLTLPGLVCWQ